MAKIFRRTRFEMFKSGKTTDYLKYAVGEIFLVVIGILIALQINNWNQEAKNERKIKSIFIEVLNDLADDIWEANRVIKFYETKDSLTDYVLNNKLKPADFEGETPYYTLILNRRSVQTNRNGFENLMRNVDKVPEQYDSLIVPLKKLYIRDAARMEAFQKSTTEIIDKTLEKYAANYEWFSRSTDDYLEKWRDYQLNDPLYKNEVRLYQIITVRNLLLMLNQFRKDAILSYKDLHAIVNPGEELPDFIFPSTN